MVFQKAKENFFFSFGRSSNTDTSTIEYLRPEGGISEVGGDDTEESYPYKGIQGTWNFSRSDIGASMKSFKEVKQFDEKALKKAVAKVGPRLGGSRYTDIN